jgi:hypothetical protein
MSKLWTTLLHCTSNATTYDRVPKRRCANSKETAIQVGLVPVSTPQSSEAGCEAQRSRIDSGLERPVSSKVQLPATCVDTSGYGLLG